MSRTLVVIGGGIAGVSCVEQLSELCPRENITLITASDVVKATLNFRQFGKTLQEFDVEERSARNLFRDRANVVVSQSQVVAFHPQEHYVVTDSGDKLHYKKLCICSGGRPNIISKHPRVIGIRDTESVQQFKLKLSKARRVVIIGNGGIALELVFELHSCQVLWAIKDEAIGSTFFDRGAATFFLPHLESSVPVAEEKHMSLENNMKRTKYGTATKNYQEDAVYCCPYDTTEAVFGGALGPDWNSGLTLYGAGSQEQAQRQVYVQYNSEVKQLLDPQEFEQSNQKESPVSWACMDSTNSSDWPVYVQFTNGRIYGCDLIVSATGVVPNTQPFISCASFNVAEDGGLIVDSNMLTNIPDVYAAGDVCSAGWNPAPCWFQMRLWSQARQMGVFAAKCMASHLSNEQISMDFCFELLTHMTQFFGYKVVLLGKFNAQGCGNDHELLVRCTKGKEYIKVVLRDGRMCGAVLIGETDLEETFENLILNQMDLTPVKEHLLNPDIDIEDYFD